MLRKVELNTDCTREEIILNYSSDKKKRQTYEVLN